MAVPPFLQFHFCVHYQVARNKRKCAFWEPFYGLEGLSPKLQCCQASEIAALGSFCNGDHCKTYSMQTL